MPVTAAGHWTEEEKRILKLRAEKGLTWSQVASNLPGRSHGACYNKYCRTFLLPNQRWPQAGAEQRLYLAKRVAPAPKPANILSISGEQHPSHIELGSEILSSDDGESNLSPAPPQAPKPRVPQVAQRSLTIPGIHKAARKTASAAPIPQPEPEADSEPVNVPKQITQSNNLLRTVAGRSASRWTALENALYIKLAKQGKSYKELHRSFPGRSFGGVSQHWAVLVEKGLLNVEPPKQQTVSVKRKAQTQSAFDDEEDGIAASSVDMGHSAKRSRSEKPGGQSSRQTSAAAHLRNESVLSNTPTARDGRSRLSGNTVSTPSILRSVQSGGVAGTSMTGLDMLEEDEVSNDSGMETTDHDIEQRRIWWECKIEKIQVQLDRQERRLAYARQEARYEKRLAEMRAKLEKSGSEHETSS